MLRLGPVTLGQVPRVAAVVTEPADLDDDSAASGLRSADVVEIRADMFPRHRAEPVRDALELARALGKATLLTVRSPDEGGEGGLDLRTRRDLYEALIASADGIDIEVASGALWPALVPTCRRLNKLVVGSFHDFTTTPPTDHLRDLESRARSLGADVFKAACHAGGPEDVTRLLGYAARYRHAGLIVLGMGPWGAVSRVAAPVLGSLLTYGYLSRPSAPGQMSCAELADLVRRFRPEVAVNT